MAKLEKWKLLSEITFKHKKTFYLNMKTYFCKIKSIRRFFWLFGRTHRFVYYGAFLFHFHCLSLYFFENACVRWKKYYYWILNKFELGHCIKSIHKKIIKIKTANHYKMMMAKYNYMCVYENWSRLLSFLLLKCKLLCKGQFFLFHLLDKDWIFLDAKHIE